MLCHFHAHSDENEVNVEPNKHPWRLPLRPALLHPAQLPIPHPDKMPKSQLPVKKVGEVSFLIFWF